MSLKRAAWMIWAGGLLVYVVGVFQRFSMSVAGVDAVDRLGITAAGLGAVAVVQVAVYASMQVPVGVLVDRFGYRRLMVAGALTMAAGQVALAFADGIGPALVARLLIGLGDGVMFIGMVRLVAAWFPGRRNPVLLQLTGLIGQLGAIASAVPVVLLLENTGWRTTFLSAAGLGLVSALGALALLRDPPGAARPSATPAKLGSLLRTTWSETGTRLGLWVHFATQFSAVAFALLWGYPFLVVGQGLSPGQAGLLLTLLTVAFMASGPALGVLVGRYPLRRSQMALTIVGASATVWTVVLVWPGPAPLAPEGVGHGALVADRRHVPLVQIGERLRFAAPAGQPVPDEPADVGALLHRRLGDAGQIVERDHVADGEHLGAAGAGCSPG
jgi:MFS family permease